MRNEPLESATVKSQVATNQSIPEETQLPQIPSNNQASYAPIQATMNQGGSGEDRKRGPPGIVMIGGLINNRHQKQI